jgi:hypothetical protein
MYFKPTLFALAIAAVGSSIAATPAANIAISSGASASKGNFKLALAGRCTAANATAQLAEFISGNNISTYVCAQAGSFANVNAPTAGEYNAATTINFSGTAFAEVRLNVTNGSFSAVCLLAGWPAGTACPAADTYLDPATGSLSAAPSGSTVVGGLLDLEPNGFLGTVRAGITLPAGTATISANVGQTFGVAVSNDLYAAMFADQQGAGKLPISCLVSDTSKPECVPVIGKAQMATIMTNSDNNAAQTRGANFLASGVGSGTLLKYARRVDTSGTQAIAQQYFLGNVCSPAPRTVLPQPAVSPTLTAGGALSVYALGSTGNVRDLLNGVGQSSPNYVVGVVSGENNQTGQTWKWVRVGGMAIGETAQPAEAGVTVTNTNTALDGRYDFWFLSRVVRPTAATSVNFWNSVITGFGNVAVNTTRGLFRTNETTFSKGTTNSCAPAASS